LPTPLQAMPLSPHRIGEHRRPVRPARLEPEAETPKGPRPRHNHHEPTFESPTCLHNSTCGRPSDTHFSSLNHTPLTARDGLCSPGSPAGDWRMEPVAESATLFRLSSPRASHRPNRHRPTHHPVA
jgi:hypothetical protein